MTNKNLLKKQLKLIELFKQDVDINSLENAKKIINIKSNKYYTLSYHNLMDKSQWKIHFNENNKNEKINFNLFWLLIEYLIEFYPNNVFKIVGHKTIASYQIYEPFDLEKETYELYTSNK